MSGKIKELNILTLLTQDDYIIPIYQRNYAWGKDEIELLIQDIKIASENKENNNYYIGSLIVYQRDDGKFEVIDGQQRLTTLHILALACDIRRNNNLSFEHRRSSDESFKNIENKDLRYASNLEIGFQYAQSELDKLFGKQPEELIRFKNFLQNNVIILRTQVPPETDLNHYFEIMNNRGEQLEKHEVLKSSLMSVLNLDDQNVFATIWDACSDMNRYAVASFKKSDRDKLFFKDKELNITYFDAFKSFDEIKSVMSKSSSENTNSVHQENTEECTQGISNILSVIRNQNSKSSKSNDNSTERFNSVINFSNFLIHVLRLYLEQANKTASSIEKISLDDKFLLAHFDSLVKENNPDEVKKFAFILLKTRFLFDLYVVKTDSTGKEHWTLKKPQYDTYKNTFDKQTEQTKQTSVLMILSMFHTAYPSRNYKNWLYAVLRGLVLKKWSRAQYLEKLEELSDRFYFNVYQNDQSFFDVIYNEPDILDSSEEKDKEILHCGVNVNHFIFNRLDYLLWKQEKDDEFRFTFRGSVEHYYPQTPIDGIEPLKDDVLNDFGNLCLVSREKNAKLSNHTPQAKKDYYLKSGKYDSLKQKRMMESSSWGENDIRAHSAKMIEILNQKTHTQQ
ncbi:DUF262 domain-containing protein [Bisgaard Taxon 46]